MSTLILVNNGTNACYINSGIQLLYSCTEFRTFISDRRFLVPNQAVSQPICEELYDLFTHPKRVNDAKTLRRFVAIYRLKPFYDDGSQQDSVEFFWDVLECFYEEVTEFNIPGRAMCNNFCGVQFNELKFESRRGDGKCPSCKILPTPQKQNFRSIDLIVPSTEMSLKDLIENHYSASANSSQRNCSNCCNCVRNCPQTGPCRPKPLSEQLSIVKSPDILIVTLSRNPDNTHKIETPIYPDNTITLKNGDV